MRLIVIAAILGAIAAIGFVLYKSRYSGTQINVDPHARREIEKAKGR